MAVMYPKFSHARPLDAGNRGAIAPPRASRAGVQATWELGTVFRLVLLAALAWGVNHAVQRGQHAQADELAIMAAQFHSEAMLDMSDADAGLLRSLPGRLEGACERNKYEPGRQECRMRLRERWAGCLAQVAPRYPARGAETEHTPMIIAAYLHCVFGK